MESLYFAGYSREETLLNQLYWLSRWALALSERTEIAKSGLTFIAQMCSDNSPLSDILKERESYGAGVAPATYEQATKQTAALEAVGGFVAGLREKVANKSAPIEVQREIAKIYAEANREIPIPVKSHTLDNEMSKAVSPQEFLDDKFVYITFTPDTYPSNPCEYLSAIVKEIEKAGITDSLLVDCEFCLCFASEEFFERCNNPIRNNDDKALSVIDSLRLKYPKMKILVKESKWVRKDFNQDVKTKEGEGTNGNR